MTLNDQLAQMATIAGRDYPPSTIKIAVLEDDIVLLASVEEEARALRQKYQAALKDKYNIIGVE